MNELTNDLMHEKDKQIEKLQDENELLHKMVNQLNQTVNRMIDAFIVNNNPI